LGAWIWLRIGEKWRTLVNTEINFWVLKMQRISWLAGEILVAQEGEFLMGLVYVAIVFLPANLIYSRTLLITKLYTHLPLSVCHDVLSTFVCTVLSCIPN
jgi:hypothetical protein